MCPIGGMWAALYRGMPCHMLYTETCALREAEAVTDGCPIGNLWAALYRDVPWAALYRGVPCYMLYTEACALREAEAVMGAPWGTCG